MFTIITIVIIVVLCLLILYLVWSREIAKRDFHEAIVILNKITNDLEWMELPEPMWWKQKDQVKEIKKTLQKAIEQMDDFIFNYKA